MTLQLFTNVVTLTDNFLPVAKGIGSSSCIWLTVKARTNGFTIGNNITSLDGFQVAAGLSIDIPISDFVGRLGLFKLDSLYWKNTTAGSNAVVEIIGMRDI